MQRNVIRQQTILNRAFLKNYSLFALVVVGLVLAAFSFLKSTVPSETGLIQSVFQRYNIFLGIIPTFTIVLLSTLKYRIADALCCQTRKVFILQTIYRILIPIVIMVLIWLIAIIPMMIASGYLAVFAKSWPGILMRMIYLCLVLLSFGYLTATTYLLSNKKLITFVVIFGINSLTFLLNVSGKPSLFYDFVKPDLGIMTFLSSIVLVGLILLLGAVLNLIIAKKDIL